MLVVMMLVVSYRLRRNGGVHAAIVAFSSVESLAARDPIGKYRFQVVYPQDLDNIGVTGYF